MEFPEKLKAGLDDALYRYRKFKAKPAAIRKLNIRIQKSFAAIGTATTDEATIQNVFETVTEHVRRRSEPLAA
jgi:hypothetical protein